MVGEFVIVLRNTDCQEALPIARRLGRLVGAFSIDNTLAINVTISLGIASTTVG